MLSVLELTDFQSHKSTRLELGRFTAVVGPTGSGKSAVVRALRLLANNARGTAYVRSGAKRAVVSGVVVAFDGDPVDAGYAVSVSRGPGVSSYEVTLPGQDPDTFTKCGTTVPEMVSSALDFGFDNMWLAGQFDRPFLLDDTGSAVARVLGDLTNVSMIYAAVRETNRRATATKAKLADRSEELARVRGQVLGFADLPARLAAVTRSEQFIPPARALERRADALRSAAEATEATAQRTARAESLLTAVPSVDALRGLATQRARLCEAVGAVRRAVENMRPRGVRPVPHVGGVEAFRTQRRNLVDAVKAAREAGAVVEQTTRASAQASESVSEARDDFVRALTSAGRCPLCGADAEHVRVAQDV